jgi:glycosyltransferase involved in cell wall biosynthesis
MIKFTIITATYNAERFLPRLLASVFCQAYPLYELIVQDGGSTDGTLDILKRYEGRINLRSERDNGIYDAWNKAAKRVTGDWAIFLGADDAFMGPHVLVRCAHHMKQVSTETNFVYGALIHGRDGSGTQVMNRTLYEVYRLFAGNMGLPFPATFVRASLLREQAFDASYKIAGDFDFAARLLTPYNITRIPVLVSYMELDGVSEHKKTQCVLRDERGKVLHKRIMPKAQEVVAGCMQHYWDTDNFIEHLQ